MHILLINSNPAVSRLITLSVEKLGYTLNEIKGFEEYDSEPYDITLVDNDVYKEAPAKMIKNMQLSNHIAYIAPRGSEKPDFFDSMIEKPFLPTDFINMLEIIKGNLTTDAPKEKSTEQELEDLGLDIDEAIEKSEKAPLDAVEESLEGDDELNLDIDEAVKEDEENPFDAMEESLEGELDELPSFEEIDALDESQEFEDSLEKELLKDAKAPHEVHPKEIASLEDTTQLLDDDNLDDTEKSDTQESQEEEDLSLDTSILDQDDIKEVQSLLGGDESLDENPPSLDESQDATAALLDELAKDGLDVELPEIEDELSEDILQEDSPAESKEEPNIEDEILDTKEQSEIVEEAIENEEAVKTEEDSLDVPKEEDLELQEDAQEEPIATEAKEKQGDEAQDNIPQDEDIKEVEEEIAAVQEEEMLEEEIPEELALEDESSEAQNEDADTPATEDASAKKDDEENNPLEEKGEDEPILDDATIKSEEKQSEPQEFASLEGEDTDTQETSEDDFLSLLSEQSLKKAFNEDVTLEESSEEGIETPQDKEVEASQNGEIKKEIQEGIEQSLAATLQDGKYKEALKDMKINISISFEDK